MGARELAAVADTGPLIHLAEIDCLDLLSLFDQLHVAAAVWREAEKPATIRSQLTSATRHTLDPDEVARFAAEKGFERLQAGDRESLYLATKLQIPLVLTDDLAVRKAARAVDCVPLGSLGIIARAFREKLITLSIAEKHLGDLHDQSSLFITRAIVDLAIEQLRSQEYD